MVADPPKDGNIPDEVSNKSANQVDALVGARVRARRLEIGMTQENLGNAIGMSFQQVQKYEKGKSRIGASRLQQIAEALAVPASYFFEGADEIALPSRVREENNVFLFLQSDQGVTLNAAFHAIRDKNVRKTLIDLVRALGRSTAVDI